MGYLKFFKKVMNRLAEVAVSNIITDVTCTDEWNDQGVINSTYEIHAQVNGAQAGYLDFEVNESNNENDNFVKLISIQTGEQFRGNGVGTQLYKAFSDFYMQKYPTYPIEIEFQNPDAEKILNKSVEMGLVSPTVLQNLRAERTYQADFRVRIKQASDNMYNDFRVFYMGELSDDGEKGVTEKTHGIQALLDNVTPVGYLEFKHYHNHPTIMQNYGVSGCLDVSNYNVDSNYSTQGVGESLYQKFSEIYNASFKGWPVLNYHVGGESEVSFSNAVSSGKLDSSNSIDSYLSKEAVVDKRTKIAISDRVDIRGFSIQEQILGSEEEKGGHKDTHKISALVEGQEVGYMEFTIWHDDEYPDRNEIFVENLKVDEKYRKHNIATAIYVKFDEIYNSQFAGWRLSRTFTNPVAEYTFRKCVELGYVSANMLQEENLSHDYYTPEKQQTWTDLRKKLPDNLKGQEASEDDLMANKIDYRKVIAGDIAVDLRNIEVVYEGQVDNMSTNDYTEISHEIYAQINGEEAGHLIFSQVENYPGELIGEQYKDFLFLEAIYVEDLVVYPKYKDLGIDLEMYKTFGQIHDEKFNEWPVVRYYDDPESEATFRKAVGLGYVHESTLNEELIMRHKSNYNKSGDKIKELRDQLPDNVKGPEVWAIRKDMRIKMAGIDLRGREYDAKTQVKDYRGGSRG